MLSHLSMIIRITKDIDLRFFALSAGYGLSTDTGAYSNDGGVCFELGTGINLCKNIYAGYAFNLQKINIGNVSSKGKVHYFRIGFVF